MTIVLTALGATFAIFIILFALGAAKVAAPQTLEERLADDNDQIKYINEYMRERLNKTDPR